jgi:pimeloyl-ACP methyl ester carboxylesterase
MQVIFTIVLVTLLLFLLLTLFLTYLVQQIPRNAVEDPPDWGKIIDTQISLSGGGFLEVWKIKPHRQIIQGTVVLAHGWGRNRDRMVSRARYFGRWGFTTIIHSARDHGKSSSCRFMNAMKFCEDIEAVLNWVGEPVVLYGHSAGAGGAIIAAERNPDKIKLLFLEACYADTKEALLSLYRWVNPLFGNLFGPMILYWMNIFYRNKLAAVSPERLAPSLKMPVMLIHGQNDQRFPVKFALKLKSSFPSGQVNLYLAPGAGHSDSSKTPGYGPAVKKFLDHYLSPEADNGGHLQ